MFNLARHVSIITKSVESFLNRPGTTAHSPEHQKHSISLGLTFVQLKYTFVQHTATKAKTTKDMGKISMQMLLWRIHGMLFTRPRLMG